ncbi:MAG: hypothetical protein RRX94_00285 [Raoultibacter sp.]
MDSEIVVHPRVFERHPEITEKDVLTAWSGFVRMIPRLDRNPNEYIAIGFDGAGRLLEMIGRRTAQGVVIVYHAMTPPTQKAMVELGLAKGGRHE